MPRLLRPGIFALCASAVLVGDSLGQALAELRGRANSDDARSVEEAAFHGVARASVIFALAPNSLGVGGRTFRVRRHPGGIGCFVYEPRNRFSGVERLLVWWVSEEGTVFPVNAPSKMLTPTLEFPPRSGVQMSHEIVDFVFRGETLPPLPTRVPEPSGELFTVKEYQAYRLVIDAPMSVSEAEAGVRAGRCLGLSPRAVAELVEKVQYILLVNSWFDRAVYEIRHASDWTDELPAAVCRAMDTS